MLELYHKGKNKLLDVIDFAKTSITRNERLRLQKYIEPLLWEVSRHSFQQGYEACDLERNMQNQGRRH